MRLCNFTATYVQQCSTYSHLVELTLYVDKYIVVYKDTETELPGPDEPVRKKAANIF